MSRPASPVAVAHAAGHSAEDIRPAQELAKQANELSRQVADQVATVVVGADAVTQQLLIALLAGGHVLLEGVPGVAKTTLSKVFAHLLGCLYQRIQFTPDLLPSDVTGTSVYDRNANDFVLRKGPVFTQVLLADEINRAPAKTQAALLEAMQDKTCTVSNVVHPLAQPFFVLATQNPLEMEGTYPLPEAQLDRFFFKLLIPYPSGDDLSEILRRTTTGLSAAAQIAADGPTILAMGRLARQVPIANHVSDYVVQLTLATHPENAEAPPIIRRYVRYGASPRGAQAIVLGAKIRALMEGRLNVSFEDIHAVTLPALRHRVILNFEAESAGKDTDEILLDLIAEIDRTA
jgi:MoxR-like ATPase